MFVVKSVRIDCITGEKEVLGKLMSQLILCSNFSLTRNDKKNYVFIEEFYLSFTKLLLE